MRQPSEGGTGRSRGPVRHAGTELPCAIHEPEGCTAAPGHRGPKGRRSRPLHWLSPRDYSPFLGAPLAGLPLPPEPIGGEGRNPLGRGEAALGLRARAGTCGRGGPGAAGVRRRGEQRTWRVKEELGRPRREARAKGRQRAEPRLLHPFPASVAGPGGGRRGGAGRGGAGLGGAAGSGELRAASFARSAKVGLGSGEQREGRVASGGLRVGGCGWGRRGAEGRHNFYFFGIIIIVSSSRNLKFRTASAAVMPAAALETRCRPAARQGWEPRARAGTQTFLYYRF